MRINSVIIILFTLLLASCQNETKYHSYRSTTTDGWHKGDTLIYQLPNTLEEGLYRIEVGIRNNTSYKYKNLWIEITGNLCGAKGIRRDTMQIVLADKSGKWLGDGISGIYQTDSIMNKSFRVATSYKPNLYVRHIMRDNTLSGIRDIGIRLIRVSD